jgi:aryl-alcohol dehydrogenase-like predicted oxidoreductase
MSHALHRKTGSIKTGSFAGSFTRRQFVKGAAVAAGSAAWFGLHRQDLAFGGLASAPLEKKTVSDQVVLGKTGIKLSRLAMGSGTNGTNHTSIQARLGIHGFADLLEYAYDRGVTFFDTADQYGTHEHMREGLRRVGKNNVTLLTKTRAKTAAEAQKDLERFCRELGRDHLDIVLLHCMMSDTWTKELEGPMEVLERAKQKGMIRAHGVSCHTLGALKLAAKTPWVEVDLARINPIGAHMDADPATVLGVLREMKAAGKGILGMKIVGQGDMANQIDRAIAYAGKNDVVDAFTIGFTSARQLDELATKLPKLSVA